MRTYAAFAQVLIVFILYRYENNRHYNLRLRLSSRDYRRNNALVPKMLTL